MAADRETRSPKPEDTDQTQVGDPAAETKDTEGQMMLPDGTGRWLARDRERDIRKHLSGRQLERQAREARKRK